MTTPPTTEDMTSEDMALAKQLLDNHKREQEKEDREHQALIKKIKHIYSVLNVSHKDHITITKFYNRRTIIGGKTVVMNLRGCYSPVFSVDYDAGRCDNRSYSYQGVTGRQKRCEENDYNKINNRHKNYWRTHGDGHKTHTFYQNRINLCPFCGSEQIEKDKHQWKNAPESWVYRLPAKMDGSDNWEIYGDVSEVNERNLYKEPIKYKRCRDCSKMSMKDYLSGYEYNFGIIDEEKKHLYDLMYPSAIIESREYFLDKRKRKIATKTQEAKCSPVSSPAIKPVEFCEYRQGSEGNVYLMLNNHTGRVKIGMTKNKPEYRESTLQSEDPDVELTYHKKVENMRETEKMLHETFKEKRYRGEWFDLTQDDIEKAKAMLDEAAEK